MLRWTSLLLLLTLGIISWTEGNTVQAGNRKKPNIIFILADDLGYGDLGCFGQKKVKTPNIDKLAREGMRFTQAYAGSTVCAPSRCTLMTGLHTGHCLVRGNARVPLRPKDLTVAELLKAAGYATALIGKWGLGEAGSTGVPNKQGFDYFYGYLNQRHAHNYYPDFLWRNQKKVMLPNEQSPNNGVAKTKKVYSHDLIMEEALKWVRQHKDEPFFLYLALTIPHANNEASPNRSKFAKHGMEVPDLLQYAKENWPEPQKAHAAMISYMDRDIGRLMALLAELSLDEDTLIIFTSDNGPHREGGANPDFFNSSGGLRGFKRSLHEGGIRVPMIVRWKGHVEPGSKSDHICAFWDFLPTAAELTKTKLKSKIDGISYLPTILGKKQDQPEFMYWEFHERNFAQGVRMGDWKAVRYKFGKLELYNLKQDLSEKNNIAAKHPEIVEQIEDYLESARTESQYWKVKVGKKK